MPRLHLFAEGYTELFFATRVCNQDEPGQSGPTPRCWGAPSWGLGTAPCGAVQLRPSPYYLDEDAQNMQM